MSAALVVLLGLAAIAGVLLLRMFHSRNQSRHLEHQLAESNERLEMEVRLRTAQLSEAKERAEEAVRLHTELSSRMQRVLDSAAEGLYGLDTEGRFTFLNRAAAEMMEQSPDEVIGMSARGLICRHEDPACIACGALSDGAELPRPIQLWSNNDRAISVECTAGNIVLADGTPVGVVVACRDVSDRLSIEKMKDEFVATVSHELRTPLTSIRGALALLSSGNLAANRAERMVEIALQNTDRLIRLVNDILDAERLASGRFDLNKTDVDAAALMGDAADVMDAMASGAGVTVEAEPLRVTLFVDRDRMMQMLTNLLSNAIKFSPRGSCVQLFATCDADHVTFHVRDHGRGIPARKLGLIFERFRQVEAEDSHGKGGSGLGLPICRSIAVAHGGEITVTSTVGEGSKFSIRLPASVLVPRTRAAAGKPPGEQFTSSHAA